jgi:hypothetical protein
MNKKYYVVFKDFKNKQDKRWLGTYETDSFIKFIFKLIKLRNYKTMDIRIRRFELEDNK